MTNLATYHTANLPELMKVIRQNGIGMDDYLDRFFNITPTQTTINEMKVALKDLKNKKKINDVTNKAAPIKIGISSTMFCEFKVLMYGIPDTFTSNPVVSRNPLTFGSKMSIIKSFLAEVLTISFLRYIAVRIVLVSALNKKLS